MTGTGGAAMPSMMGTGDAGEMHEHDSGIPEMAPIAPLAGYPPDPPDAQLTGEPDEWVSSMNGDIDCAARRGFEVDG